MSIAAVKIKEAPPLVDLARQALADAGGDVVQASKLLEDIARKNMRVWVDLTEQLLSQACYQAVSAQIRQERRQIWTAANYSKGGNGDRVRAHANSLLDFLLPGGMRLRDATASDVLEAAGVYRRQAVDMTAKADWLFKVAERCGRSTKTVGLLLKESDLQRLRDEVTS